ncbi:MAG: MaoC family dehydratase N-terminal domain-containing protein [Burkholderiaceae bacterium]
MKDQTQTLDPATLAHLKSWIGKSQTIDDRLTEAPVRAMSATLDRGDPLPGPDTEIPPLWHWLYFLPHEKQSHIGPDGHPKRGGFLPPVPLPRRMWAGGRLHWHAPLRVGDAVTRKSTVQSVEHKSGRSGEMVFVLVRHEVSNDHGVALTEEHDIVYRAAPKPGDPAPQPVAAERGAPWSRTIDADPVLLFRYSALTFNGHRIHYDRQYVVEKEGYPGLVVHGPLIATLLVDLVRRDAPDACIEHFDFKAVRPTFDQHPLKVNGVLSEDGSTVRLWAEDHAGWLTMTATATLA